MSAASCVFRGVENLLEITVYLLGSECGAAIVSRCAAAGDQPLAIHVVSCVILERQKNRKKRRNRRGGGKEETGGIRAAANGRPDISGRCKRDGKGTGLQEKGEKRREKRLELSPAAALLQEIRETRQADKHVEQRGSFF
jgi:hypothetical protein